MKTKKVGSTGRFGSRYGRKIRLRLKKIEEKAKSTYVCPNCKSESVKRVSAGIWMCRKCNLKFAGEAYSPSVEVGA